jgi:hypothetical protein
MLFNPTCTLHDTDHTHTHHTSSQVHDIKTSFHVFTTLFLKKAKVGAMTSLECLLFFARAAAQSNFFHFKQNFHVSALSASSRHETTLLDPRQISFIIHHHKQIENDTDFLALFSHTLPADYQ